MPIGLHKAELNFETLEEIGHEGKNSQVFLAHDKQLDGKIVVKKIEKSKLEGESEYYQEAKILYASTHPYVVKVNYGCADDDYIYIAMPYYKNGSLKKLIDSRFLTVREVLRYSIQFLSGLNNIHSKGLMHFDIKPDNILLSDSNEALLSDFGLSKAMNANGFVEGGMFYSKQIPPEVFAEDTDRTVHYDIYLAGLTLYRMLNGNVHFYNQYAKYTEVDSYHRDIIEGQFPDRNAYFPHVPIKLQRIVNKAISIQPSDRYNSVLEFNNALGEVDENLDWRYSELEGKSWTKEESNKRFEILLNDSDPANIELTTYKTLLNNSNRSRVTKHCHNNCTSSNISSKLKKALKEL